VRDESGRVTRLAGTHIDLTERRRLEESVAAQAVQLEQRNAQLRRQSHELQRSNEELERFAYAASHDLQEPLRMVTSFTTLLAEHLEGRLDEEAQQYIDFAVDGAARMRRLIQDLLTYSRVGSRGVALTEVDVTAVLADAQRNLHVAIEESGATITHDRLPVIRGDETQIGQIFQNLLGNALKFRSSAAPAVHVVADDAGDSWHFAIRDNGIGIEPRHVSRLFVMFQRLHTRAEYPGTGIGLALCRRLVERHGGRIWVESAFGEGATFHFTLPKARPILASAVEPS
jgi:light-regulated signal transduction histidine kinase (bacteriophytochrome)